MADSNTIIEQAYAAFNARDIDGALVLMTDDVHWPKASEGGTVFGKEEIRAYWTRQWSEFDPHVQPLDMREAAGKLHVTVHQVVRSRRGDLLSDSEVAHTFTFRGGLICAMQIGDEGAQPAEPSAAFSHHTTES